MIFCARSDVMSEVGGHFKLKLIFRACVIVIGLDWIGLDWIGLDYNGCTIQLQIEITKQNKPM